MPRDDKLRPQFILDRTVRSDRTVHRGVGAARAPMPDVCVLRQRGSDAESLRLPLPPGRA